MNPLAVALVGCGDIAFGYDRKLRHEGTHTHCAALAKSERFRLTAVCDAQLGRAEECARAYGVPTAYDSIDALVAAERAEVIVICTPDKTHATIAHTALAMPGLRALVMEKPVAFDSHEAEALLAAARGKNVSVAVNYSRRYAAGIEQLRETIRGERVRALSGYYTKGVRHNGTHWFDLAEFLAGPVRRVAARDALGEGGADPTLDVQLEFASGASGFLKGCAEQEYSLFEMDILTDQGRYTLTDFGRTLQTWRAAESPTRTGYRELVPGEVRSTALGEALPRLWSDLAEALDQGRAPLSNGDNARRALQIAETAVRAAGRGEMCPVA